MERIMERTMEEVLEGIFAQKPLPNNLKQPKKSFKEGTLGIASKVRIIEQFSKYEVRIICIEKPPQLI